MNECGIEDSVLIEPRQRYPACDEGANPPARLEACAAPCVGDAAIIGCMILGAFGAIYIQSHSVEIDDAMAECPDGLSFAKDGTKRADALIPGTGKMRDGPENNENSVPKILAEAAF